MTNEECKKFEAAFGFPLPTALIQFLSANSFPAVFGFSHVQFVLEIQYLLNIRDPRNQDLKNKRLAFAVTTDGYDLLVDFGTDELRIMQMENEDIDFVGLTINDLLTSTRAAL